MSRTIRFTLRRPFVTTGLALIGLAVSAAVPPAQSQASEKALLNRALMATSHSVAIGKKPPASVEGDRPKSAYFAEFTGVGLEERDMVWCGAIAGAALGEVTVRLAHVGREIDSATPTWPVEGIIFVSGDDPRRAFAAEVHGSIDWPTKRAKLEGDVSVGYMRGRHIELIADVIDGDLSGDLRLAPAPAPLAAR